MSAITGGVVSIEDGVKPAVEYTPPRKVRVELRFDVLPEENAQERLMLVAAMANLQVKTLLGYKTPEAAMDTVAAVVDAPKKTRAKKAEATQAETFSGTPNGAETSPVATVGGKPEAAIGLSNDTVSVLPAELISDKKLFDIVFEVNSKIKRGKAITAIIERYCPDDGVPPSLKNIPEAKRAAFLAEVRAFAATVVV